MTASAAVTVAGVVIALSNRTRLPAALSGSSVQLPACSHAPLPSVLQTEEAPDVSPATVSVTAPPAAAKV